MHWRQHAKSYTGREMIWSCAIGAFLTTTACAARRQAPPYNSRDSVEANAAVFDIWTEEGAPARRLGAAKKCTQNRIAYLGLDNYFRMFLAAGHMYCGRGCKTRRARQPATDAILDFGFLYFYRVPELVVV